MPSIVKARISRSDISSIQHMFNQLFGIDAGDPHIFMTKFKSLHSQFNNIAAVLEILIQLKFWKLSSDTTLEKWQQELQAYQSDVRKMNKELAEHMTECEGWLQTEHSKSGLLMLTNDQSSMASDKFNQVLVGVKKCKIVKQLIVTVKNIEPYIVDIALATKKKEDSDPSSSSRPNTGGQEDDVDLGDYFIIRDTTPELTLLRFTGLDIKHLWVQCKIQPIYKRVILSVINKLYEIGKIVHDLLISPNIDIKQFSEIAIQAITSYEDELPRCKDAFDVIRRSVKMLEAKFDSFYRDAMKANNPGLIFEAFLNELRDKYSKKTRIYYQIFQICNHLRKQISNIHDPEMRATINQLENQFSFFDKFKDETDFDVDVDIEPDPEVEPVAVPEEKIQPGSEPESEVELKTESEVELKTESEVELKIESEVEPKTESDQADRIDVQASSADDLEGFVVIPDL